MLIALIGCNSLLAGYLTERLLTEPVVHLTLLGRRPPAEALPAARTTFTRFDYPATPLAIAQLCRYDAIVYCAAAGVQAGDAVSADATRAINYELPARLLAKLAARRYTGKWLSFGTYFELGATLLPHPASETEVVGSTAAVPNEYCASKRALTAAVAAGQWAFPVWHLVLPTIYGAREHADRLIPYLVRSLRQGTLPRLSAGTQVRQYVHGRDVADLAAQLLLGPPVPSGVYNVPGPDTLAIRELVELVFARFGQPTAGALGAVSTRDESMPVLHLSGRKLAQAVPNWQPQHRLATSLAEYL